MFKVRGNYPYPVLFENAIDYKNSVIKARYKYLGTKSGHKIKIECEINNDGINQLIKDKKVCYAVQIESPNALYRKMFEFYDKDDIEITLNNNEVIDFIDIGLALLVKEDINDFYNDDLVDSFEGIKMQISKNEVLAVCENVRKIIVLQGEVLKDVHSIFNINKKSTATSISYNPNNPRIQVTVPEEVGNYYLNTKGNKQRIKILNSIIFMPILIDIINDMENAESWMQFAWYKTLVKKIDEIVKEKNITIEEVYGNAHEYAQVLMQNISVESIKEFKELFENMEGDDD